MPETLKSKVNERRNKFLERSYLIQWEFARVCGIKNRILDRDSLLLYIQLKGHNFNAILSRGQFFCPVTLHPTTGSRIWYGLQ